ncbi:peptidyl-prolyl cis-trans isomerase [Alkalicoccus halolimnae]|uniref:Peptidyl-prolyl cis-trans isomerase n=1 Tax=Alkalicoccus halolimnae TaxID=1667239 RepID=A0A5C7FN78_9BACI|nr:peptidyl-prolyl cis-trans isomerase [Alkalicoccus halolimnae]TXF87459.1 peptidyl-prolyl cis-trans isomerase [Alkalicoccus halolimnae]
MDNMLVKITGLVKYPIMIDPGVWIFDERREDMEKIFESSELKQSERDYAALGKAFDEQRKGAKPPQTNENKVTVSKKDLTEKSFGISLAPFMKNAEPTEEAESVRLYRSGGKEDIVLPLRQVEEGIVAFSNSGNPLKESGPLHFYYRDGSNRENPITHVQSFSIE